MSRTTPYSRALTDYDTIRTSRPSRLLSPDRGRGFGPGPEKAISRGEDGVKAEARSDS